MGPSRGAPDGIVVLGGAISPDVSAARDAVALNEAAERITAAAELARRYPNARIVFSGGSDAVLADGSPKRRSRSRNWRRSASRTIASRRKSNRATRIENAVFSRLLANPKPGERWLLVTSAYHMPRAIAAFRAADFAGRSLSGRLAHAGMDGLRRALSRSLSEGLRRTDAAAHEWVGLLVYRLTGQSE